MVKALPIGSKTLPTGCQNADTIIKGNLSIITIMFNKQYEYYDQYPPLANLSG